MNDIDILKVGDSWDARYDLPLFPYLNNPWAYGAYVLKLLGRPQELVNRFTAHAGYCEIGIGYFRRWPDGSGGPTSHDELLGMAYACEPVIARRILSRLEEMGGVYNSKDSEYDTMYRFLFLVPFLRKRAGYKVGLTDQLKWSIHVVWSAVKSNGSSGPLKIWLMEEMKSYPICSAAFAFWKSRMKEKGPYPRWMFEEHFPAYYELSLIGGIGE